MSYDRTSFRNVLRCCLAVMALFGASTLVLGTSTTAALARGGHGGYGGFHHHGGFYRHGFGFGWGPYPYYGYGGYWPYEGDAGVCYAVSQRVKTRWGWGIRRVSICE